MKYFKNTELAKLYNISEKSVRNWIQATRDGKMSLQLHEEKGKFYIANTTANIFTIENLAQKGKKYHNKRAFKAITPSNEFYKIYNQKHIFDIISNIDIHRDIPHQYSYFGWGAEYWDNYAYKLFNDNLPNSLTNTIDLFDLNAAYLNAIIEKYEGVNIIDIGVGNCLPVRGLLENLLAKKKLKKYVAIDISQDILEIAEKNIKSWFGNKVHCETYLKDIAYDKFEDILVADSFRPDETTVINIVLFLGGTISNLRNPDLGFSTVYNSMGKRDLFILTRKLDTPVTRRHFDFTVDPTEAKLSNVLKFTLEILGIEESLYTVEQFFDPKENARKIQIRLKMDIAITFEYEGKRRKVEINKDETLLIWRSRHQDLEDTVAQFKKNRFGTIHAAKARDGQYLMIIAKIRPDEQ